MGSIRFTPWQACLLLLLCLTPFWAAAAELQVYVRDGCPHCAAAKAYLPQLAAARPTLRIVVHPVDRDPAALAELQRLSHASGVWPPGLPTFAVDGRLMVGFDDAESSGPLLEALIDQQPQSPQIDAGPLGKLSVERLGLPLFTLAIGLLDGFNPCAMWVLLFLLSMLVHLRDRPRMALIAGTFVAAGGLVYYAFLAAWLNLFLLLPLSHELRWVLAALALLIGLINLRDFFRHDDFTLAIPQAAKPGLYARVRAVLRSRTLLASLLGVSVLAVLVNFIELLCSAGFPAMYSAILAQQPLDTPARYAYLALYIAAYCADDALMVTLAVVALGSNKLSANTGRWLKLLSGLAMFGLGIVMLLRPGWLL